MTPSAKRQAIAILHDTHGLSIQLACQVVRLSRTAYYQPPGDGDRLTRDQPVIDALQTLVAENTRWASGNVMTRSAGRATRGITSASIACTARSA